MTQPAGGNRAEQRFLMRAHASGMLEKKLSELAITKAADPAVRAYAQKLVRVHREMEQDLAPLLSNAGLDPNMTDMTSARPYPSPDMTPSPDMPPVRA